MRKFSHVQNFRFDQYENIFKRYDAIEQFQSRPAIWCDCEDSTSEQPLLPLANNRFRSARDRIHRTSRCTRNSAARASDGSLIRRRYELAQPQLQTSPAWSPYPLSQNVESPKRKFSNCYQGQYREV